MTELATATLMPGDRAFAYLNGGVDVTITRGPHGNIWGDNVVTVSDASLGHNGQINSMIVYPLADAQGGWHVVNQDGRIVAGGPRITEERATEIATHPHACVNGGNPNGLVVTHGLPAVRVHA